MFYKGRAQAKLPWVRGYHDLRHFRATQWLLRGVDIQTVKSYLGHKRIETTQRYLHFVPSHAEQTIRAAQAAEQRELDWIAQKRLRQSKDANEVVGRHLGDSPDCHDETKELELAVTA